MSNDTPTAPKQAVVSTVGVGVSSGGASIGFALILFILLNNAGVFGAKLSVAEAGIIQGSFSLVLQSVFAVAWSIVKQMLTRRGYNV